jgi:hypothetical protein
MENLSVRRLANLLLVLTLLLGVLAGCKKKTETAAAAASATPAPSASPTPTLATPAPPITGAISPALVSKGADSITQYLHFPNDPEATKLDGAVQFFCDINEEGIVVATHALIGTNDAYKEAVQTALDWGHFTPATIDQKPVPVYLGGTIFFLHEKDERRIVVSLATQNRERVRKMTNYIEPQLVGGLRHAVQNASDTFISDLLNGRAEVVVNVDQRGVVTGTTGTTETPKGNGLGSFLEGAMKRSQFTPAYDNAKPVAGAINVVADFRQL